jgi:hypothetical protein
MTLSLRGKTVLITGASSGTGEACAKQFAAQGTRLILTARRIDRIEALSSLLEKQYGVKASPLQLDIQNKEDVIQKLSGQEVDILVNNAGVSLSGDLIQEGSLDHWDITINTNLRGLLYVTHSILPQMIERNQGHIINIGSSAAHEYYPRGNVYCATKHAVKAISKSLRIDLLGKAIRVSEIDPGIVYTEFNDVRWNDKERVEQYYSGFAPLKAEDVADAVLYCATRPLHVDIAEIVLFPTDQASANHLFKKGSQSKGLLG